MSDIEHPYIDPFEQLNSDGTLARELAEEAAEVLTTYGYRVSTRHNNTVATHLVTDRIDIIGAPDDTVAHALRLTSVNVLLAKTLSATSLENGDTVPYEEDIPNYSYLVLSL